MPSKRTDRARRAAETTRSRAAARATTPVAPAREAVIYARVSSKDQEKEGFSIPAQLRLLQDYAATHGYTVVQEFVDVETAKRAGRTNFNRMLELLREPTNTCRTVLVEKTDRLYRNITDWVTLDGLKLEIHLVKEGAILSEESRSSEKFIHGIKVLMAKNYVDNLSEETKKGMYEKVRQGIWPGPAPLGYRNVRRDDGKNVIEVDFAVAPKVIRMFEIYAGGDASLNDLVKWSVREGLTSKKGNKLHASTIHQILRNRLYIGEFIWHGELIIGDHHALVTRETWERVQDMLSGKALVSRSTQFREFAFAGLVLCAWCASEDKSYLLVPEQHKGKYTYYTCGECKRLGRQKYHREPDIEAAFLTQLQELWVEAAVLQVLRKALRESHAMVMEARDREVVRIEGELKKLQARMDKAYDDRLDGHLPEDQYLRRFAGWREEQDLLHRELRSHANADASTMEAGVALLELATTAVRLWEKQDATARRKILAFLSQNSTFGEEGLTVTWREPFDLLAEITATRKAGVGENSDSTAVHTEWLPLLDLN